MTISDGARQLPPHHLTIRVPWHDGGWTGRVAHCLAHTLAPLVHKLHRTNHNRRNQDLAPALRARKRNF